MAAAAQRMAKPVCESSASPKTPSSTTLVETVPLHVTPLDAIDSERDPDTPHKESSYKKKSGKLVSKRKLFLQSGQNLHVNKVKRHAGPKIANAATPTSRPVDGSRPHFPLTERQQLQYLLEVTAKEAKEDSGSSSNDDLLVINNRAVKKDTNKDNQIEARIRKRNERGETALHVAAIRGDLEDIVALIKAGALVNAKDNAGWTPLHEACNFGNLSIVQELVWSGADVNSPGYEAITPLHDAVINDHVKVVKFLLENGADPKLQTSQSYNASDLARSEAVLTLLNPDQKSRECYYSVESQGSLPDPEYSRPNHHLPEVKINGLNSSFIERSSYDDRFDQVEDAKNSFSQGFSFQNVEDAKMLENPQEKFDVNGYNHSHQQDFSVQDFPAVYGFPGNAYHFTNQTEVSKESQREAYNTRLLSKEIVENNNKVQVRQDYGAWHFQEPPCDSIGSVELQSNKNTEVVDNVNEVASSDEYVQDIKAESTSVTTYPNSIDGPVDEDLDQMHVKNLPTKKPGRTVTSESEEDAVRPEKLNACLDKAMIEISSYLETGQKVVGQVPCDRMDLSKCDTDEIKNAKPQIGKTLSNELVGVDSPQKPQSVEIPSNFDNCRKDHTSLGSSLLKRMECNENSIKVFAEEEEAISDAINYVEQQPHVNYTKIKTRSEKKKESGVSERSGKSFRKKRTSTRSSDISKSGNNQGLQKEECASHIQNRSWRSDLPKFRYSMSSIPVCVPGYEDFLINSENSKSRSKPSSSEVIKDPGCENELERLISQHNTEKVKLRMTLEQELIRLFGNYARKSAGYQVPYSACTIISSQMREPGMKQLSTEKEQPLSIKLEVDKILCKFNKLKTEMLKRHNREIEVVLALENFWQQNEGSNRPSRLSTGTYKDFSEDFELLPAKFHDYYEEVLCATD